MIRQKGTRRPLGRRCAPSQLKLLFLSKALHGMAQAALLLAGEVAQAPGPISVMSQLSCASLALSQWLAFLCLSANKARVDKEELERATRSAFVQLGKEGARSQALGEEQQRSNQEGSADEALW